MQLCVEAGKVKLLNMPADPGVEGHHTLRESSHDREELEIDVAEKVLALLLEGQQVQDPEVVSKTSHKTSKQI